MTDYIQPITESNVGLANTWRGKLLNYNSVDASMICLEDIAKGLSNICRFGGQISDFYSVAQHTLLVWHLAPTHLKRAALLHDAAEAYLGDVVKPLKVLLGDAYAKFEKAFETVIFEKYGVSLDELAELKQYDIEALEIENNYFRFGRLDFISKFYVINNEEIQFDTPYRQLLALLNSEFLQAEISYHHKNNL